MTDGSDPPVEYHRKGSAASHMGPADVDEAWLRSARHLHATGVFAAISDTSLQAAPKTHGGDARGRPHASPSIPTCGPRCGPRPRRCATGSTSWRRAPTGCCPAWRRACFLTGESTPEGVARFYRERGAKLVVVKLGAEGAYYDSDAAGTRPRRRLSGGKRWSTPWAPATASRWAWSARCSKARRVPEAVRRGAWIGARAVQVLGDTEGLPTRAQLDEARL